MSITFVRHRAVSLTLAEAGSEFAGTVHLASGETLDFTHCILATGMEANRPEVPAYPDALPVYNLGEAEWIRNFVAEADEPLDVGVLGSGYLGIEVASAAVAPGTEPPSTSAGPSLCVGSSRRRCGRRSSPSTPRRG